MYSVLICHNVTKYTEFYQRYRFNVIYTYNTRCLKKSITMVLQMLLCGECYENV
jgi:hypothetical protein